MDLNHRPLPCRGSELARLLHESFCRPSPLGGEGSGVRGKAFHPSPPTPLPRGARGEQATPLPRGARGEVLSVGAEPTTSALSERRALRCSTRVALPTGLEPVLSTVTEWRPLRLVHGSLGPGLVTAGPTRTEGFEPSGGAL